MSSNTYKTAFRKFLLTTNVVKNFDFLKNAQLSLILFALLFYSLLVHISAPLNIFITDNLITMFLIIAILSFAILLNHREKIR